MSVCCVLNGVCRAKMTNASSISTSGVMYVMQNLYVRGVIHK